MYWRDIIACWKESHAWSRKTNDQASAAKSQSSNLPRITAGGLKSLLRRWFARKDIIPCFLKGAIKLQFANPRGQVNEVELGAICLKQFTNIHTVQDSACNQFQNDQVFALHNLGIKSQTFSG